MQNAVLLSPTFPTSFKNFVIALKRAGANVLGIDSQPYETLPNEIKKNIDNYYRVEDLHNYNQLVNAMGYFTYRYGKLNIIESHNEHWLETEARLREDFNIPGPKMVDMEYMKKKSEMKKIYRKLGLKTADGMLVYRKEELFNFIKKHGFPIILKPDNGVGAEKTFKIDTFEDLDGAFKKIEKFPYIAETYIEGTIYSFDGMADSESNPVFYTSHVFSRGVMEAVNNDKDIYYYSLIEIPEKLREYGLKCLKGFNIKNRFFHLEFFYTPDGEFVPLEVNIRPSGGFGVDMYNFASDFDVFQIWANLVIKGENKIDYERKYIVCYIGRKYNINYIYSHSQVLERFSDIIVMHRDIPAVLRNAMGDYMYLVRGKKLDDIMSTVSFIQAQ